MLLIDGANRIKQLKYLIVNETDTSYFINALLKFGDLCNVNQNTIEIISL